MTKSKSVFKKRTFCGNRHTIKVINPGRPSSNNSPSSSLDLASSSNVTNIRPTPTPSPSSSKIKLASQSEAYKTFESKDSNIIISFNLLSEAFSQFTVCNLCGGNLRLTEVEEQRNGLACKFSLLCLACDNQNVFWNSKQCDNNLYEVNLRMFYGLRCIGKGGEGGKVLCGLLNLPRPSTAYTKYTKILGECVSNVSERSMISATKEAVQENGGDIDISIAFDGTWQKRGYKSKNGCCTVTSVDTGKVLDVDVLTKYCSGCVKCGNDPQKIEAHKTKCLKNYHGSSSGGMEPASAITLFNRSVNKRGVRYKEMLSDGDSKAYLAVCNSNPYPNIVVSKLECINHVAKRMGSRLRNTKASYKGKVLSDGKPIRSRLSDKKIDELQTYYSNAIRDNCTDLNKMKKAVWAIYFHKISTDENPNHGLCPAPPETWCKYRKAEEKNELATFTHKNSIPVSVMEVLKPDFKHLANPDLLKRCLHGKTQNVNEAFNNVVWTRIPKNIFVGRQTLELGVYEAVSTFNDGNITRLQVLKELGFNDCGKNTYEAMKKLDEERLRKAEKAVLDATKEARLAKKRANLITEAPNLQDYNPGAF